MTTQLSERNLIRKFSRWLRPQTTAIQIDEQLLTNSRTARASRRLLQGSVIVNALMPLLVIGIVFSLTTVSVMAQGPSGGSIFGGNDQTLGNGVREIIKWGRNLLFLLGIGGLMWAAVNYMTEKNWTKQALGGVFCFAFGAVASLAYSFSQGNAVNLDTDLGG
jgi:hypothetical protein